MAAEGIEHAAGSASCVEHMGIWEEAFGEFADDMGSERAVPPVGIFDCAHRLVFLREHGTFGRVGMAGLRSVAAGLWVVRNIEDDLAAERGDAAADGVEDPCAEADLSGGWGAALPCMWDAFRCGEFRWIEAPADAVFEGAGVATLCVFWFAGSMSGDAEPMFRAVFRLERSDDGAGFAA
jgi:hypothetical protein